MEEAAQKKESAEKVPEKKKSSIVKILIPLVVVIVVCGVGSYIVVSKVIEPRLKSSEEKHQATQEEAKKSELPGPGPEETGILDLGEQIVHLQPEKGSDDIGGIVKVNVTLEWDKREVPSGKKAGGGGGGHGGSGGPASAFEEELDVRKAKIKDLIDRVVSTKTYTEVLSPDNKERLRQEIAERVNAFLTKGKITQVYFTEFIPQY